MNISDNVMEFGVFWENTFIAGATLMRKCGSDKNLKNLIVLMALVDFTVMTN